MADKREQQLEKLARYHRLGLVSARDFDQARAWLTNPAAIGIGADPRVAALLRQVEAGMQQAGELGDDEDAPTEVMDRDEMRRRNAASPGRAAPVVPRTVKRWRPPGTGGGAQPGGMGVKPGQESLVSPTLIPDPPAMEEPEAVTDESLFPPPDPSQRAPAAAEGTPPAPPPPPPKPQPSQETAAADVSVEVEEAPADAAQPASEEGALVRKGVVEEAPVEVEDEPAPVPVEITGPVAGEAAAEETAPDAPPKKRSRLGCWLGTAALLLLLAVGGGVALFGGLGGYLLLADGEQELASDPSAGSPPAGEEAVLQEEEEPSLAVAAPVEEDTTEAEPVEDLAQGSTAPSSETIQLYEQGRAALARQDAAQAESLLQRCVEQAPDYAGCWWELGWAHWLQQDWPLVLGAWERVQAIDPQWDELDQWLPQARQKAAADGSATAATSSGNAAAPTTSTPQSSSSPKGYEDLQVSIADGTLVTSVEVTCPSGYRQRVLVTDGVGIVRSLPSGSCTLHFKGSVSAKYSPVVAGQEISCMFQQNTAVCR